MTAHLTAAATTLSPPPLESPDADGWDTDDWLAELDIAFVESGVPAEQLIRMTDDGCNSTCATACVSCGT